MSSDHPFDDQLKQSFDGFEPNVHANWAEFERSLDVPQAAEATSSAGRGMNRWAVAAAVAAGGALMWVAKPVVERAIVDEQEVVNTVGTEDGQSFDEAWAEFTSVTEGFVEDVLDVRPATVVREGENHRACVRARKKSYLVRWLGFES